MNAYLTRLKAILLCFFAIFQGCFSVLCVDKLLAGPPFMA